MILLFWFCVIILFYTYFGYPPILFVLSRLFKISVRQGDLELPITLIIAAYNEEKIIREKIKNSLSLDYPQDKLEVIVVSDGSSDATDYIVKEYEQVKLIRINNRSGKVIGHRAAVREAKGEILIFSDATGMCEKKVFKKLIRYFADEKVGCVGGMLKYIDPSDSALGGGEGLYWKYEVMLRKLESKLGSLVAVSGSIYAVRKKLYVEFPEKLADDFIIPLFSRKQGYYTLYEPQAICFEETVSHRSQELSKRARIANQNIRGMLHMREMFNPFRYPVTAFVLFSHKLLRQLVPLFMIGVFSLNLLLAIHSTIYTVLLIMQSIFYGAVVTGYIFPGDKKPKMIAIPYYFFTTNLGILLGIIKFIGGKHEATWDPIR